MNYRYRLYRNLIAELSDKALLVCMLNPSTADDEVNDPTIDSVCRLAKNNGFSKLLVINLFAIRATEQQNMWMHKDPIGPENWDTWQRVLEELDPAKDVVALAWGRPPKKSYIDKYAEALTQASYQLSQWNGKIMTWITNVDGSPRHPLYIKADTLLIDYSLEQYLNRLGLST